MVDRIAGERVAPHDLSSISIHCGACVNDRLVSEFSLAGCEAALDKGDGGQFLLSGIMAMACLAARKTGSDPWHT